MTTVVRTPEDKLLVLLKGADTICLPLIAADQDIHLRDKSMEYLDLHAR